MIKKEKFVYDRSLRELFGEIPKTLIKLLVNQEIKEILDITFPKVEERKVDLLTRLEDDTLFHLEIQSIYDKTMPERMLQYALLIYEKYKEFPKQLVLYVGEEKLKIKNNIKTKNLVYNYEVRDIREFDCSVLIESENIADNIIAILCDVKDMDKLLKKLNDRLKNFSPKKREDYLRKFFYLLGLRKDIKSTYKEKVKGADMPFVIDVESHPLFLEGEEKGREEGKLEGLQKGIEKGQYQEKLAIARSLLEILDDKTISDKVKLPIEEVRKLRD
jgi:hypothetical protein